MSITNKVENIHNMETSYIFVLTNENDIVQGDIIKINEVHLQRHPELQLGELYEVYDFVETSQDYLGGEKYYDICLKKLDSPNKIIQFNFYTNPFGSGRDYLENEKYLVRKKQIITNKVP